MDPTRFDDIVREATAERIAPPAPGTDNRAAGRLGRSAMLKTLGAALASGLLGVSALTEDAEAKRRKRRQRKRRKPAAGPSIPPAQSARSAPKTLWASVDRDGSLTRGSGALSSTKTSEGGYQVFFDRDVEECAHFAQIPYFSALGEAYTHRSAVEPTSVIVFTYDTSQARVAANKEFHLMVIC